jgi:hypothetical protein
MFRAECGPKSRSRVARRPRLVPRPNPAVRATDIAFRQRDRLLGRSRKP